MAEPVPSATPPELGVALPELTDALLTELRMIYHGATPDRKGAAPSTHSGLRAVYEHLRTLTVAAPAVLRAAMDAGGPPGPVALTGIAPGPAEVPWDVLVRRRTGDTWRPVRLIVEAIAALNLAFADHDFGEIQFADRSTGHLLVQRLPWEDTIELHEGNQVERDLPTVGYRVIVPAAPPELIEPTAPRG